MKDFKAGRDINVKGDVHIIDNSNQLKLFAASTTEALFEERIHRKKLLHQEQKAIRKRFAIVLVVIVVLFGVTSLWFYIQGNSNLSNLILGLGGLVGIFASLKFSESSSEFESRQINALKEIGMILRDRGIER